MKRTAWLAISILLILVACQSTTQTPVYILDGDQTHTLYSASRLPAELLNAAGVTLSETDLLLFDGAPIALDEALPEATSYTLQVRRAVTLTIQQPGLEDLSIQSSALTVGQALDQAGFELYAADLINPPADTPISGEMEVYYQPAQVLYITADGDTLEVRSAAATVGQALAEVGISLQGLDYSTPSDSEPLPADGGIRVVRVQEMVSLTEKTLPYKTDYQPTADLEIDQQAIIQVGENGLAISRVRVRYEDGLETSRQTESETVVRPPQDEVVGYGTQIVIRTVQTPDGPVEYWRTRYVYATSYSPCNSGSSRCYYNTSSGKPVTKGVIAVIRSWYYSMRGQPVYVPDYGYATIEDVGGGFPDRDWIDLGWSEAEWAANRSNIYSYWTTIYFLTPVPDAILYILP